MFTTIGAALITLVVGLAVIAIIRVLFNWAFTFVTFLPSFVATILDIILGVAGLVLIIRFIMAVLVLL